MVCVSVVSKCAHAACSRRCTLLSEECAEGRAGVGVSPFPGSEWSRAVQPGHRPAGKVSTLRRSSPCVGATGPRPSDARAQCLVSAALRWLPLGSSSGAGGGLFPGVGVGGEDRGGGSR